MLQTLNWTVGFTKDPLAVPQEMVPATVPGAVQLDWARAHDWGDHNFGDNFKQYGWMEDVCWLYRAPLTVQKLSADQRLFFVCKGIDYRFRVMLRGEVLHEQEGMFTPFAIELTNRVETGDVLEVLIFPAPKSQQEPQNRDQANQSCKPAVSYGWDFHPRLIPLGIWDETGLEVRPALHLKDAEVAYQLSEDLGEAEVSLHINASAGGGSIRWKLVDADGRPAIDERVDLLACEVTVRATVRRPHLWWPNGQGEPYLYTSVVELLGSDGKVRDRRESRVGFRRVKLVMHPDGWVEPSQFPKGRSVPPITLEINGRRIFAKGSNWVSPDIFPGRISRETYLPLLKLAQEAHMNLLRCWGGAPVQKEAFFELCDELGLMVWQEFPLACNRYEGTPHYLKVLDQESRSIIQRLRPHACVVLWCGGNELFNAWSRMTDQDLALRLLNRNTYDLDPSRPFLPTAPIMGMAHGSYAFKAHDGKEVHERFAQFAATAYTEFGVASFAIPEVLRRTIPEADQTPDKEAYETERGKSTWSKWRVSQVKEYFGEQKTLEDWCAKSFLLQGEGLRFIFEEARRQWPRCSMALNWCLNEPWPTVANLSIVTWPHHAKPSVPWIAKACRPVVASAKASKFRWKAGELFNPELWLLSDSPKALPAGRIDVLIRFGDEEIFVLGWDHTAVEANSNVRGPVLQFTLPSCPVKQMTLVLRSKDHPERDSEYLFVYDQTQTIHMRRLAWSLTGGEWVAEPGMPLEKKVSNP